MYNTSIHLFALPDMDDASLCKLIQEAYNDPATAEALALAIDQLPVIKGYLGQGWQPYYDEALPFTERDVQRNIRKFPERYHFNLATVNYRNPDEAAKVRKCFINWVLMILKRDCFDVKRRQNPTIESLDEDSNQTWDINQPPKLSYLDELIAEEELEKNQRTAVLILRLVEKTQKELLEKINSIWELEELTNCHPKGYPQANCAELIRRRLLRQPAQRWGEIAGELQTPYGTVTAHWHRRCLPIIDQIDKLLTQLNEGENQ